MGLLDGKHILICGARNKWSIGWHCAKSMQREGATLGFSVFSERERDDVAKLLAKEGLGDAPLFICNAAKMDDVERLFDEVSAKFDGKLDGLLHAIAFASRESLSGEYVATTQGDFGLALDSSVYTLVSLARGARPLLAASGNGAIVALTYGGSVRVVPNYNVMGVAKAALESSVRYLAADLGAECIRVNAVSAGPIKTLSAQGISGFSSMLAAVAEHTPAKRNVTADEVGDAAAFLMSKMASGITGEVLYVDNGYHIMGM